MARQRHALGSGSEIARTAIRAGNRGNWHGLGGVAVGSEAGATGKARANGYRAVRLRAGGSRDGRSTGAGPWAVGLGPNRLRAFSPLRVGHLEAAVWVAYYQREWGRFLALSVLVVRTAFGMDWIRTVHGAWLVLRANQLWAPPPPKSDPAGARRCMRRFYALLRLSHGEPANPARAAELEVEWWRVHRIHQRGEDGDTQPLVDALSRLYAYTFGVDQAALRPAAEHRARAMDLVDQWVIEGRRMDSPLLPPMRAALVRSHAALLAAVHR
jgi:hypothetical protein